ncbi:MAG: hypothetical protein H0U54_00795 [Acidobacteria bacterium]|nr:hypothetical protein [Acidobacteriota bacterium]
MDNSELQKVVDAWIAGQDAEEGSPPYKSNWWAIERVIDWGVLNYKPELLWRFILAALQQELSDSVVGNIAAGPLEDLLDKHGPDYIDRVEALARKDERFNHMLGGVWIDSMTDEVQERIKSVRRYVW